MQAHAAHTDVHAPVYVNGQDRTQQACARLYTCLGAAAASAPPSMVLWRGRPWTRQALLLPAVLARMLWHRWRRWCRRQVLPPGVAASGPPAAVPPPPAATPPPMQHVRRPALELSPRVGVVEVGPLGLPARMRASVFMPGSVKRRGRCRFNARVHNHTVYTNVWTPTPERVAARRANAANVMDER